MNVGGFRFNPAKLSPLPERLRRRKAPDTPEQTAAQARYAQTLAEVTRARNAYRTAQAQHAESKAALRLSRVRAGAVLGSTGEEP